MFWLYVLRCADGSYYTGHTDNLERRLVQHHSGTFTSCYTFDKRPLALMYSLSFSTREEALSAERKIKGWSRAKKEALIRGDWQAISALSRNRQS